MKNQITIILFKIWPTNHFWKAKSYNFHFHNNYVTWPFSANGLFTFYIQCTHLGVYEYTKTKGLDSREVTSLPKCQHVINRDSILLMSQSCSFLFVTLNDWRCHITLARSSNDCSNAWLLSQPLISRFLYTVHIESFVENFILPGSYFNLVFNFRTGGLAQVLTLLLCLQKH